MPHLFDQRPQYFVYLLPSSPPLFCSPAFVFTLSTKYILLDKASHAEPCRSAGIHSQIWMRIFTFLCGRPGVARNSCSGPQRHLGESDLLKLVQTGQWNSCTSNFASFIPNLFKEDRHGKLVTLCSSSDVLPNFPRNAVHLQLLKIRPVKAVIIITDVRFLECRSERPLETFI